MISLRRFLVIACASAVLVACGGGGGGSSIPAGVSTPVSTGGVNLPPVMPVIPEVASQNGTVSLTLQAQFDGAGRPAFFYNGVETAPTIRVQPGDTIHLRFINALPEYCAVGVVSNANLHFHGLTSAPVAPGDETIATNAAPGGAVDYTVQINPDQPPGLYWYHPHPHGLSSWEVGNGMAGVIVVEGIAAEVPATAGLRERVIILGDVPTDASLAAGESGLLRRTLARRRRQSLRTTQDADAGGAVCGPETDAVPTINGKPLVAIGIRPGETQLFRVVNASGHRHFDLAIDGAQLRIVAQDGVPIHDYPGAPQSIAVSDIVIPPAGRAEFLVTGQKSAASLISKCYNAGSEGDPNPQVVLGVLADDSTWTQPASAAVTAHVRAASALRRSQFYRQALPAAVAQRTIHFSEDDNGFYLEGKRYDPGGAPAITAQSGTVEEWTLVNDSNEAHVFHIHQVHFVVESVDGAAPVNPHWVDSFDIPPQGIGVQGQVHPSQTKVLVDFRDPVVRGTFLYHCHILDHEDGGMMAKIVVR